MVLAFAAIAILALSIGGWYLWKYVRLNNARENLKKIEELAKNEKNFEAYDLALQEAEVLPGDETLAKILLTITDTISVNSEPPGAKVYLRRFQPETDGKFPERRLLGEIQKPARQQGRKHFISPLLTRGLPNFIFNRSRL